MRPALMDSSATVGREPLSVLGFEVFGGHESYRFAKQSRLDLGAQGVKSRHCAVFVGAGQPQQSPHGTNHPGWSLNRRHRRRLTIPCVTEHVAFGGVWADQETKSRSHAWSRGALHVSRTRKRISARLTDYYP